MDKKNTTTVILVVVLIVLGGFTYYLYSGATECEEIATGLGTQLQECAAGLDQYEAGLAECLAGVQVCQDALTSLKQVPDCAPYIPE